MAKEEIKTKTNIGSSSLILIFIILCLSTFGLLSLTSAKSDWNLARKNADAVTEYYRADQKGIEFLDVTDQVLSDAWTSAAPGEDGFQAVLEALGRELPQYYDPDRQMLATDIAMDRGQALRIEIRPADRPDARYQIQTWKVYNQIDYEIDDSMPVWDGT